MEEAQHLPTSPAVYAGFWLRLVAALVDSLAMFIPFCMILFVSIFLSKLAGSAERRDPALFMLAFLPPVGILATILYFALMESSPWQATLGKKVVGLYVTDIAGRRPSLVRAIARNLARFLSSMTAGVGYLMCGFTEKKQALHDIVAKCLVLRGTP
jgi:uncharacterized RDD family membrane protein YckC